MLILLLFEVGKKAPLHTYKISNIVKQQSFQENIKLAHYKTPGHVCSMYSQF